MEKFYKKHKIFLLLLFFVPLLYCSPIETSREIVYTDDFQESTYNGSPYQYFLVNTNTNVNLTYQLNLGGFTREVFFIFTNTSTSSTYDAPTFLSSYTNPQFDISRNSISHTKNIAMDSPKEIIMSGNPKITAFNQNPPHPDMIENPNSKISRSIFVPPSEPRFDTEGDTQFFYIDQGIQRNAVCAKKVTVGDTTVNIWVDLDKWYDAVGNPSGPINDTMITALSNKFLIAGADNDIYDYVTDIYSDEWGTHPISYLLDAGAVNNITILLYDIDCYITPELPCNNSSGTMGYFYSKDNYKPSSLSWSNGRLMFYLDSEAFADPDGSPATWDITDAWPSRIVSTTVHEFQHLVHFYQKKVKQNLSSNSEAWVDEMCSMVTEDLLAKKIETNGPRGMDHSIASSSTPESIYTRLDYHNDNNDYSVTSWSSSSIHYGNKYAFGAYLARNYDGADLFRKIVQNNYTDYRAITTALAGEGISDDFGTILRKWGIANLLSDKTDTPNGVKYNNGNLWMDSSVGITYSLGSINLFDYDSQPKIINISSPLPQLQKSSNLYIYSGLLNGTNTWELKLPNDIKLTVVVRDSIP